VLDPELLELVYEADSKKVQAHVAHVPEGFRLEKVELNRAETRVHNFIEFIAADLRGTQWHDRFDRAVLDGPALVEKQ
jgi:hypothetical protein